MKRRRDVKDVLKSKEMEQFYEEFVSFKNETFTRLDRLENLVRSLSDSLVEISTNKQNQTKSIREAQIEEEK